MTFADELLNDEPPADPNTARQIQDAEQAKRFIFAGNSRTTLVSNRTGERYTYRVAVAKDKPGFYFVSLLTGSDNESDYTYIGIVDQNFFRTTAKTRLPATSAPIAGFAWTMRALLLSAVPVIPRELQIWHEGRCGRCNRALTDPVSIARGLGPECASK